MNHPVKILEKKEVAKDTWEFRFEKPKDYTFLPGQFLNITVLGDATHDDKGNSRYMSICSAPQDDHIELLMRIPDPSSSFKKELLSLSVGAEVEISDALGHLLIDDSDRPLVFIAGGMGVTPFLCMAKSEQKKGWPRKIYFFCVNRTKAETAYFEELEGMKNDNFVLVCSMTREDSWGGETGYITGEMISKYVDISEKPIFYIVGKTPMVQDTIVRIKKLGVEEGDIRREMFGA